MRSVSLRQPVTVRASASHSRTADASHNSFKQYAVAVLLEMASASEFFKPRRAAVVQPDNAPPLPPEPMWVPPTRDPDAADAGSSSRRLHNVMLPVAPVTLYDGGFPLRMMVVPNPYTKAIRLAPMVEEDAPEPMLLPKDELHAVEVTPMAIASTDPASLFFPHLFPPTTRIVPSRKLYTLSVAHLQHLARSLTTKLRAITSELTSPSRSTAPPTAFAGPAPDPTPRPPPEHVPHLLNLDTIQAFFAPKPPAPPPAADPLPEARHAAAPPQQYDATAAEQYEQYTEEQYDASAAAYALHNIAALGRALAGGAALDAHDPLSDTPPGNVTSGYYQDDPELLFELSPEALAVEMEAVAARLQQEPLVVSQEAGDVLLVAFAELAQLSRQLAEQARADELALAGYVDSREAVRVHN